MNTCETSSKVTIAVDCMGGDYGLSVTLPACKSFLTRNINANLILVGDSEVLSKFTHERVRHLPATEVISMGDSISVALRQKRNSSMHLALKELQQGRADVVVSAGNTGALMAVSHYYLKTLPSIERPAIVTQLPNMTGGATTVLDLGANVDCTAKHLLQFALMGAAFTSVIEKKDNVTVGLLNIGEESIKGNDTLKQASQLLRSASEAGLLNFYGNVEGNDIFKGVANVVVCDGFVGNAVLKASEGVAIMISSFMREEFSRNIWRKLSALCSLLALRSLKSRLDHRRYNGAALLGLGGLVFKSHGSADAYAFERAILRSYNIASNKFLEKLSERMNRASFLQM